MGKSILLLGPKEAGKTQIRKSLAFEAYPSYMQTNEQGESVKIDSDGVLGWLGWDKITITEFGGLSWGFERGEERISNYDKVIYVLDGVRFIHELQDFQNGSETSSRLRHLMGKFENENEKRKKLFVVATHADKYDGDMRKAILSRLQEVNKEYKAITSSLRYPFTEYFEGDRFYCFDATDYSSVDEAIKRICNY